MAVPYSALLLASDVNDEAQEAFKFDITDPDTLQTVEALIQQVTGMLEGAIGLDRNLIVREYTHYFNYGDWEYDEARDKFWVYAPQWPVVEIDTTGFASGVSRTSWQNEADIITYTSRFSGAVNYYAGYKRPEQDLTAIQTELANLDTLPPDLPYDIRGTAINGVLKLLFERNQGPGQRTRVMNPAVQTTTIQAPVEDYIRRRVRQSMQHHRRLT